MTDVIRFEVKDWPYPDLERAAEELALLIYKHKSLIDDLNSFMRISSKWWEREEQNKRFQMWKNGYIRNPKKASPDKINLANQLEVIKEICETPQDWEKMRGLIPEKIFEIYFDEKNKEHLIAYGTQVLLHNNPIVYRKQQSDGTTFSRRTVDAGSWNGLYGEFAEVKFRPEGFGETDIGYLNLLEEKLDAHAIDHCIYLVTFEKDHSLVRRYLKSIGVLSEGSKFEVLGPAQFV